MENGEEKEDKTKEKNPNPNKLNNQKKELMPNKKVGSR